ncbi:MAG: 2-aminoethylphosphonate--pyruvate transaminase [Candidatus Brocadiae bacterium]|nr:2-aminoethylphosphonate--pyruvate transaminase [Candidatus Brocadiia bacterium]
MEIKRNILLNPGPATTTDSVKMSQVVSDICPREKEFGDVMEYISSSLTKIAGGDERYTTVLLAGSGTAAMDAMINSVVPDKKKILIINNGAYGDRMAKIAKAYSIGLVEIKYDWCVFPKISDIEQALKQDPEIDCIGMVHHETTTGMLNPVPEIGCLCKKYGKTFLVDSISSFAGIPFSIQEYNIDFMASTSNKCIQGMAGCAFVICKTESLLKTKSYKPRSFYLNLYSQYEYFSKSRQMQFTPPVQILYALKKAIEEFWQEGAQNRHKRYLENWKTLILGMARLGFKKLLPDEQESHILTTFHYPDSTYFDFDRMHDLVYKEGFTIYPGKIGGKDTFRLANMGDINCQDIEAFCHVLENVLKEMRVLP